MAKVEDRVFNPKGRKHYRRTYEVREVKIGAVIALGLALIAAWVMYKGAHPDPALFNIEASLQTKGAEQGVVEKKRSLPSQKKAPVSRGPIPDKLASKGWREGKLSQFDAENLYVKVNGRADFYKSFGFQRLFVLPIFDVKNEERSLDVEVFDFGKTINALGAYNGERQPNVKPEVGTSGMAHIARNALFVTRGKYYVRAIGSDESEKTKALLGHVRASFEASLEGEALPFSYALFVGALGLDPGKVNYHPENAFSFGFAKKVHSVMVNEDLELFVQPTADDKAAKAMVARFHKGFLQYGTAVSGDKTWVKDRYLGVLSGAKSAGLWVVGVRSAANVAEAESWVAKLAEATKDLKPPIEAPEESTEPPTEAYDTSSEGGAEGAEGSGEPGYE